MQRISALMCVYNDAVFTKACLEGIQPYVDQIVIVEGSWNGERGTYDYGENKSSDDGTRRIVEQFAALYPDKVILLDSAGDEESSRNLGLNSCDHDWVLHLDSDEFYWPNELDKLRNAGIEAAEEAGHDMIRFTEKTFYFNFKHYMNGSKIRMFNAGHGVHYSSGNGVGDILKGGNGSVGVLDSIGYVHFQWIGDRYKVLSTNNIEREKRYQREDLEEDPEKVIRIGGWRWWLSQIYLKFDGTNLEELEKKNLGSIHPWSFLFEDQRGHRLTKVEDANMFPEHIRVAPWFDFKEEGLVTLEPDLA